MRTHAFHFFFVLSFTAACGGHIATTDDGDGGSPTDGGGHPPSGDGGPIPGPDSGPRPPPPPPPPNAVYGYVLAQQQTASSLGSFVTAVFAKDLSQTCALSQPTGTCQIANCQNASAVAGLSAGTITVSGGSETATLAPQKGPNGVTYGAWQRGQPVWTLDQPLGVSATGDVVPAFQTSFSILDPIKLVGANGITIDTRNDYGVEWDGGASGEALFYLANNNNNSQTAVLVCFFPVQQRKGLVPQALLRQFQSMSTSSSIEVALVPTQRAPVVRPPFFIQAVTFGDGTFTSAQIQ